MADSIAKRIRTWLIANNNSLKASSPFLIDFLGNLPTQYDIVPLPAREVTWHLDYASSERVYHFAFQSMEHVEDDATREGILEFYEALSDWFDSQTRLNNMPTLGSNQVAVAIQTTTIGFLYNEGQSGTGVYQIQCQLEYDQFDS